MAGRLLRGHAGGMNQHTRSCSLLLLLLPLLGGPASAQVQPSCAPGLVRRNGQCQIDTAVCDPRTRPFPEWGASGSRCLRSCGALGGTTVSNVPCADNQASVGPAYDGLFCCRPCRVQRLTDAAVRACYDALAFDNGIRAGECGTPGEALVTALDARRDQLARELNIPVLATPGYLFTRDGCRLAGRAVDEEVVVPHGDGTPVVSTQTQRGGDPDACIPAGRLCGQFETECFPRNPQNARNWDQCFRCCNGNNGHDQQSLNCPGEDPRGVNVPHIWLYNCTP